MQNQYLNRQTYPVSFSEEALSKGVMYDGKWCQGINWIDWALLFILPVASTPAFIIANKKRKELKEKAEEA